MSAAEVSAHRRCSCRLPFNFAPSSCHRHAPRPVAIVNGRLEIGYRTEERLFAPHRQDLEHGAGYKQRYWKMNEDRMLGVWRLNCCLEIERPGGNPPSHSRVHFSTTIVPVILG